MAFRLNDDKTATEIDVIPRGGNSGQAFFTSLTGVAVHSSLEVTTFSRDGVNPIPMPNPVQPPDVDNTTELPLRHYWVEVTEGGELHIPPLAPEEAAEKVRRLRESLTPEERSGSEYEQPGLPEMDF